MPFTFPWFGNNYTQLLVQTNGFVSFDTTVCTSSCFSNTTMPSTTTPNNAIFGWHDDLSVSSGVVTTHNVGGEFVIQYANVPNLGGTYTINMQIRLSPAGTVVLHYGTFSGAGTAGSASVGFEGPGGTQGLMVMARAGQTCTPTSQTGCCSGSSTTTAPFACTVADVVAGTRILIGEPVEADLGVPSVTLSNLVVQGNGNLTFDVQAQVRNYGQTAANGWLWRAYLSLDAVKDAGDQLVASGGPVSLGPTSVTTINTAAATTTPPAQGAYYVLFEVDSTNVVMEASELNNVGATVDTFVSGLDLVAASISGVSASGGGNVDNIQVNWRNRGTTAPGPVEYRILLSANTTLDANDFVIHTGTRNVTGGETVAESVAVTMPAASPNGTFYYLLQIDPNNLLTEALETNNVVASGGQVTITRADLVAEFADFVDPATGLSIRAGRFGEPARATVRVSNQGGANANNFYVALVVSTDATLSLLSDTLVCEQQVTQLATGGVPATYTLNCPLPLVDRAGAAFTTGQYYFFLVTDSRGSVYETNKGNNNLTVGPVRVTAPGADLMVAQLTAPASAGVGETVPVVRTLRNVGTLAAPAAAYRYVASVNDIITPDDIPLEIIDPSTGASSAEGSVTLARDASDSKTELVRLPASMAPGTYFIGCIIDPQALVADLDRANNALPSQPLPVAASSLRIATSALPDATVGLPYQFRLAAVGEMGASTWSIDTSQGPAPAWLTLSSSDGTLSGTPTTPEVASFTVKLENAGRQAVRRLAMRVLPPTTQVIITTTSLPAVVNSPSTVFSFALGAAGGARPYTWRLSAGTLPSGLTLSADGVISGSPRGVPNGNTNVTVEVTDSTGGRASQALVVRLVPAGSIFFRTLSLAPGLTGQDYLQDIAVQNADGSPLAKPLKWTVTGSLPDGLSVTEQTELITLSGRPQRAGLFNFTVSVQDASGRGDSMAYALTVYPPRYRIAMEGVPTPLYAGDTIEGRLTVSPSAAVTYAVVSGALPPGVSLSAEGALSGTVAAEGAEGLWTFVVEARDAANATGLSSLAIEVSRPPVKQGCSSVDLSGGPAMLLGLLALLRRRRRS
ncbi:MAG: putative Ig domain-containing protein [Myxococcota bacterium]